LHIDVIRRRSLTFARFSCSNGYDSPCAVHTEQAVVVGAAVNNLSVFNTLVRYYRDDGVACVLDYGRCKHTPPPVLFGSGLRARARSWIRGLGSRSGSGYELGDPIPWTSPFPSISPGPGPVAHSRKKTAVLTLKDSRFLLKGRFFAKRPAGMTAIRRE
jgi:hypothetical protein